MTEWLDNHRAEGREDERHGPVSDMWLQRSQLLPARGSPVLAEREQAVLCERAVFELTRDGMVLTEVAPRVYVQRDVIARMGFKPRVPPAPAVMSGAFFRA